MTDVNMELLNRIDALKLSERNQQWKSAMMGSRERFGKERILENRAYASYALFDLRIWKGILDTPIVQK